MGYGFLLQVHSSQGSPHSLCLSSAKREPTKRFEQLNTRFIRTSNSIQPSDVCNFFGLKASNVLNMFLILSKKKTCSYSPSLVMFFFALKALTLPCEITTFTWFVSAPGVLFNFKFFIDSNE